MFEQQQRDRAPPIMSRLLSSELFLATVPPIVMLVYALRRDREFDNTLRELREEREARQRLVKQTAGHDPDESTLTDRP